MSVEIVKPGLSSTLQDAGRFGYQALGVGRAGAMDGPAWRLANALVGNSQGEAAIECTMIGPSLRFERAAVIALTGAPMAAAVDGQMLPMWTTCLLPAGSLLRLGGMSAGCRSYLAVRGGFAVTPLLGSRSSDMHARIGHEHGRALRAGDVLPLGTATPLVDPAPSDKLHVLDWSLDPQPWFDFTPRPLALLRGSHDAQLDAMSRRLLYGENFVISHQGNRTASRLDGHKLRLQAPFEMISEAALPGTLQLPPSGQPIVLMAEAPVTGGYPRIGQLAAVDLPRLAQRRPGDTVCFRDSSMDEALTRLAARRQRLTRLIDTIAQRLQDIELAHDRLKNIRLEHTFIGPFMNHIDLNGDLGESFGAWRMGDDDALLTQLSSANIACGFHAGDPDIMQHTVARAIAHGVAIGAHVSLPDLQGFGRREFSMAPAEVHALTLYQIGALHAFTRAIGTRLAHVKPHGALYNMAARDAVLANAIARAVRDFNPRLRLFGLAGSALIAAGSALGLNVVAEGFVDRRYRADGSLQPRREPDAVIDDIELATAQAIGLARDGEVLALDGHKVPLQVDTLCLHGDGAHAVPLARRVRAALEAAGMRIAAPGPA